MEIFSIPILRLSVFLLILFRISAFLLSAPIFGDAHLPTRTKIGLSILLSVILLPIVEKANFPPPTKLLTFASQIALLRTSQLLATDFVLRYGIVVFKEIMTGVIIGYAARLAFAGIDLAGQLIGIQMGFGIVNIIDPEQEQLSIIAQFHGIMAILIFLILNGHHWLMIALAKSFEAIPLAGFAYSDKALAILLKLSGDIFVIAFKISAPVIVALFLTNVTLGVLAKAIPQMDVFMMSFPLTIIVGLLSLAASLQMLGYLLPNIFHQMQNGIAIFFDL